MLKFEYMKIDNWKIENHPNCLQGLVKIIEIDLNYWGNLGWELVCIIDVKLYGEIMDGKVYYFKRRLEC